MHQHHQILRVIVKILLMHAFSKYRLLLHGMRTSFSPLIIRFLPVLSLAHHRSACESFAPSIQVPRNRYDGHMGKRASKKRRFARRKPTRAAMVDHLRLGCRLNVVLLHGGPRAQLKHVGLCRPLWRNRRVRWRFWQPCFSGAAAVVRLLSGPLDRRGAGRRIVMLFRVRRAHRRDRRPPVHPRRRALRGVPHPARSRLLGSDHRVGDRRSRCASCVAHGGRNRLLRAWPGAFHVGLDPPSLSSPRIDRPT